jgi:hypothetical protein
MTGHARELLRAIVFRWTCCQFADGEFPDVTCINVVQELSPKLRGRSVAQMLRRPRWSRHSFTTRVVADCSDPALETLLDALREANPGATVTVTYGEPVRLADTFCRAAAWSRGLGLVAHAFPTLAPTPATGCSS